MAKTDSPTPAPPTRAAPGATPGPAFDDGSVRFGDVVARLFPAGAGQAPTRARLRELYDDARRAVHAGELPLAGHSLPTTLNVWLERFGVRGGPLKRDVDVVDFSFADGPEIAAWLGAWQRRISPPPPPIRVRAEALELLTGLHALDAANRASLGATNGTKDDLLAALSDVQAQVALLLRTYDDAREALRLPSRAEPLERFRASGRRPASERTETERRERAAAPKRSGGGAKAKSAKQGKRGVTSDATAKPRTKRKQRSAAQREGAATER